MSTIEEAMDAFDITADDVESETVLESEYTFVNEAKTFALLTGKSMNSPNGQMSVKGYNRSELEPKAW